MTTKKDYTTEEWNTLTMAPLNVSTYMITADMSAMGAMRELKALSKELKHPNPPETAQELVTSLVADIQAEAKNKEPVETPATEEGQDPREPARQGLRQTAVLLNDKCTTEEAAGFKQWLVDVAQTVAEADKEGSHFGMGGVRVTEKEKEAMAEIEAMLNE